MLPRFITAFLKSSGHFAVVIMEHEGAQRVVVVDREALSTMCNPPRADESRLQESVGAICEIAASKMLHDAESPFSRVRVSADDVAAWKTAQGLLH